MKKYLVSLPCSLINVKPKHGFGLVRVWSYVFYNYRKDNLEFELLQVCTRLIRIQSCLFMYSRRHMSCIYKLKLRENITSARLFQNRLLA